jgi:hypothetical protein
MKRLARNLLAALALGVLVGIALGLILAGASWLIGGR